MEAAKTKDRAHTIYKNQTGKRVPGCSTIAGILDKPALKIWANRIGLEGIDVIKYVDSLADAGTLAHYLVECEFKGIQPVQSYLDEYGKIDQERADNSMLSFHAWKEKHDIEVIVVELKLVSEEYQFGGQLDTILVVDGVVTLVDIKTAKALYGPTDDKWTQVGGYEILAEEHGYHVDDVRILRIGRDESEGFEYAISPNRELHKKRFIKCREIYEINKLLRRK